MPLPTDCSEPGDAFIGTYMRDVSLRDRQARVSELRLDIAKVRALFSQVERTRVSETMDVDPVANICTPGSTLEHPSHVAIVESLARMRAEYIRAGRADRQPGLYQFLDDAARDGSYSTLAALALQDGNRTAFVVDVHRAEIKRLVAAELGVEVDRK